MYLIQTVQTSWRPQLPLPKELEGTVDEPFADANMERLQHSTPPQHTHKKDSSNSLNATQNASSASASNKKWSFGRLFRKKKDIVSDSSSEEDRKAGFVPAQKYPRSSSNSGKSKPKSKSSSQRSSKALGSGFDHIVMHQPPHSGNASAQHVENEFFLPVETISPTEAYYQNQQQYQQQPPYTRSSNSLDRRAAARAAHKSRSAQRLGIPEPGVHSSSEEELISLNSSTFSKYRSDESIHSGGQGHNNGQSRRSRAARNERYYKRLSRDGEPSHGQVPVMYAPQPAQRWKTQPVPLSIYNGPPPSGQTQLRQMPPNANQRLRNTGSLQHVGPYVQWGQMQQQQLQQQQQPPKNLQNSVNDTKRSISYDSQIHLQNVNGRMQTKPLPPPPPPRDPQRRVNVLPHSGSGDLRPTSYAFDQQGLPVLPTSGLNGRCVSDDKIWAGQTPHYQSAHSLNIQPQAQQQPQPTHSRRFITRAERDAQPSKKSLPNGLDFHYVADATPRSRKPIHMLEQPVANANEAPTPSSGILRTTKSGLPSPASKQNASDFWKRLDEGSQRRGRDAERPYVESSMKPRSISSSRVGELRTYPIPMYTEVVKPKNKSQAAPIQQGNDEVDNVVCGSLHIKSNQDNLNNNYVEIRNKDFNKSNSMPNHYQRRSGEIPNTPNKYEEYVAEKRELHHQKPVFIPPTPPQRKLSIPPANNVPIYFPRKKPANLEEAINELEAIYKSLGLSEESEKKERIPMPSEFEKYALAHADEYDDEDSPAGEPDPVRDDVAYRNIKLANLQHKTAEKQPPFGIPIGPIVPAPQTDYLHVTPAVDKNQVAPNAPDIVKDDLAVRALRKDPPGPKERFVYPCSSLQKKNRATRTQSANIYSLIQRDAAKPSGGDIWSYMELTKNLDRAGSMSDLHKGDTAADIPATLKLLQNLKEQEQQLVSPKKVPFRHPSQGGAICQLPEKLVSASKEEIHKAPVPLPRKSLTPEPSNVAGSQMEDALNKIAKEAQESSVKLSQELQELRKEALITASRPKPNPEEEKLEKDLQEIEAVSEAAKRCGKMLLEALPDAGDDGAAAKPRKLHKEGKLIKAIDQVSEAANAVCEKILKDIVTTEPPVVVHEAVQVRNKTSPVPVTKLAPVVAPEEPLVMPTLIKKLDPIQSEKIEAIAKRCMRQLSELADEQPDYDNLRQQEPAQQSAATIVACNARDAVEKTESIDNQVSTVAEVKVPTPLQVTQSPKQNIEEIDKIMQECEAKVRAQSITRGPSVSTEKTPPASASQPQSHAAQKARLLSSGDDHTTAPSMTASSSSSNAAPHNAANSSTAASSFSSSSDCLAKSSSPSASRRQSSSITSFNPYSSSDYIKSPSSEYHAPSTDPIKTFSTTSYDVQSSSATPNINTNSTFSYSPSPPLNLTPVSVEAATATRASQERTRARSSSPSQYNSSEELAMIFGIEEKPKSKSKQQQQQQQQRQKSQQPETDGAQEQQKPAHVTGKVDDADNNNSHAACSVPLSSSNHASCAAKPECAQLTNPNAAANACNCVVYIEPATNATCLMNVVDNVNVDVDATTFTTNISTNTNHTTNTTTIITTNTSTSHTTTTNLDVDTNTNTNANAHTNNNTPTNVSTSSCKLATIPELHVEPESWKQKHAVTTLSPNFNKVYASKISIIVEQTPADESHAELTQCDSLSSLEETSSNPDSGNVSLADFPLAVAGNNACLQLQSAYNSRFEVKSANRFVSEIAIESEAVKLIIEEKLHEEGQEQLEDVEENVEKNVVEALVGKNQNNKEHELADSLQQTQAIDDDADVSEHITEQYSSLLGNVVELNRNNDSTSNDTSLDCLGTTPVRKRSIVIETPHLNMNISEVKVNYELNVTTESSVESEALSTDNVLAQITQCTAEVEKLNEALNEMPRRRAPQRSNTAPSDEAAPAPNGDGELRLLPWRHAATASGNNRRNEDADKPSTSANANVMSLFGELRPATANGLTTLEHVLMACSLGVISPADLYTLFLIIVGMITIVAIVLF